MSARYALSLMLSVVSLASGCSLLTRSGGSVTVYAPALSSPASSAATAATHERRWQIVVAEPQAPELLLGTRILVAPQPGRIEIYHGARWQDAPATLLKFLLVQALHEAGATAAADSASIQRSDFRLESDLVRFQAEYRGAAVPLVSMCFYARLIRAANGDVVATREFCLDEPAASSALPVVVEAFDRAVNRLVRDSAAWAITAGDDASPPAP